MDALTILLDQKIIDKTNLTGFFDIHIQIPDPFSNTASPSFFTVIEEELGLKLVSDKGPVEVLVIDQIKRPSEN